MHISSDTSNTRHDNEYLSGTTPLPHLGVIRAYGPDAVPFLHGQLTNDFAVLKPGQARLAALCSAKGRMLASFIGIKRADDEVLLVCQRDVLEATLKRLKMFVLRAKVGLSDENQTLALYGCAGDAIKTEAAIDMQLIGTPWHVVPDGRALRVELYPALGVRRQLWVGNSALPPPIGAPLDLKDWLGGEVHSGVAMVGAALADTLVPQMLNYESVGGVSFKKGCYPGQEVVARSQFRGTIKRRAMLAHSTDPMPPGGELFVAGGDDQPTGIVVQSAKAPSGGWDAIVCVQLSAIDSGKLAMGSGEGTVVVLGVMPYSLLEDV